MSHRVESLSLILVMMIYMHRLGVSESEMVSGSPNYLNSNHRCIIFCIQAGGVNETVQQTFAVPSRLRCII